MTGNEALDSLLKRIEDEDLAEEIEKVLSRGNLVRSHPIDRIQISSFTYKQFSGSASDEPWEIDLKFRASNQLEFNELIFILKSKFYVCD